MNPPYSDRVLILDFGSQYTRLIARRVREAGVYCEIMPCDVDPAKIKTFAPRGFILSGGPATAAETQAQAQFVDAPEYVYQSGLPVLGICYGMQTMAARHGGKVVAGKHEFGYAQVRCRGQDSLLKGIADDTDEKGAMLDVWMSHGDRVETLPPGFQAIAATADAPIAGMADETRNLYGLQFHPEVTHTKQGKRIFSRFIHDICGCAAEWTPGNIIADTVKNIRATVGDERVLLGLSGGVDSAVAAALLHKAIGDRLTCVFVDNGLLRLREGDEITSTFARIGVNVARINAQTRFLRRLRGVADPEKKRKIIGNVFIEVFEEAAAKLDRVEWLAQGTIYPDVIESAASDTAKAAIIKSHHNVGGLPERMKLKLLEPLRELFKDEVRAIGAKLGLPAAMVNRHPFPGPGLGVRILGEVKQEYADILRQADHIFMQELKDSDWHDKVAQAFAVFLPVKSVGVTGDARRHDYVIALRAVVSADFMTAQWARLPHDLLDRLSRRIINELPRVSRVVYDISGKPPATIEWE